MGSCRARSGHGVTWLSATVAGKGIDRADRPGDSVEATIQARDECGRPWAGASLPLRATLVGPLDTHVRQIPAHVAPMSANGGVYNVRWSATSCGHHALRLERADVSPAASASHLYGANALYNNSIVGASPYRVMIKPGPANASRSYVAADPSLVAGKGGKAGGGGMTRGVPVKLMVRAVDSTGCPLRAGGDTVRATLKARVDIVANVVDKADGTYEISFTPNQPGPALLQVTINGQSVGASPPDEDDLPRCSPSPALATPAPTGAPYAVHVADRGAALVGGATLAGGATSPAPSGGDFSIAAWIKPIAATAADGGGGGLNRSAPISVVSRGSEGSAGTTGFRLVVAGDATTFTASLGVVGGTVRNVTAPLPSDARVGVNGNATTSSPAWSSVDAHRRRVRGWR